MSLLESEKNYSAEEVASLLQEVVPLIVRTVRAEMRKHRDPDLSVPQQRALAYIGRHPGASLSDVANHIGLTLPSISKMIDRLVTLKLVERRSAETDRRRIALELTALGESALQTTRAVTRTHLAEQLAVLSDEERAAIIQAMHSLQTVFGNEPTDNSKAQE